MKLRWPIQLADRKQKPQRVELGATGTVVFAGQLTEEEYNRDLQGDKAIKVFERMRRSDGQVKAALLACELPLRAARWEIEAASESSKDQEIAEFVRANLFDQMTITWDDFLRHVLMMLPFGFSVFEKIWEVVDGKYRWRKMAPRLANTIWKWEVDPEGGLAGVEQAAWKGERYEFIPIPIEKLLVFTLDREGSNYAGISLLRAAYKHWYYKDVLYRIDGIAAERHGVGVALFKLPAGATTEGDDSDLKKVSKIGESLHTHERSYVALPNEYEFDLKGVSGQLHDIMRSIEHHDMQIARSILAQFINLGAKEVGSYALSQDQSGFFLMALRALGKTICNTMSRHGIKQLVDYNWDVDVYPKLTVSGLERRDLRAYSSAVASFAKNGLISPDKGIEAELRRYLRLPQMKKEDVSQQLKMREFKPWRHLRGVEKHVAFKDINDKLDSAEDQFVKAAKAIQDEQIVKMVEMVATDMEKGQVDRITEIPIPLVDKMSREIEKVLDDLFEYGQKQVKQELQKQRAIVEAAEPPFEPIENIAAIREFLKTRAKATASVLGNKLRAAMAYEALRQVKEGAINRAALSGSLTTLSDKELVATAKFSVSEAMNFGRQAEAKAEADDIDRVVYSALLDENTCGPCGDQDGREYPFPSAEWEEVAPPYKNCEGQDRCRCVGVYVYKSETGR